MKLFGGKKAPVMASPTERVSSLYSQGLSEPEIIEVLKQEGYGPIQVDRAMTEVLRGAATGMPRPAPRQAQRYEPPAPAPMAQMEYPSRRPPAGPPSYSQDLYAESAPEEPAYPPPAPQQQPPGRFMPGEPPLDFEEFKRANKDLGFPEISPQPERALDMPESRPEFRPARPGMMDMDDLPDDDDEPPIQRMMRRDRPLSEARLEKRHMLEELTEGVVEEKWTDFRKKVDDLNAMFQDLNQRISGLEQRLGMSQNEKRSDLMEIEEKIDTYKKSIDGVESRMESVERAMKDSLTPMMQTLRSLSETIKTLKEKR